MTRPSILSLIIVFSICGCIGPFKKKPIPEPVHEPVVVMAPTVSIKWDKISAIYSDKSQIRALLGSPDFIDKHKTGEDWYYSYTRSTDFSVISFPVSGHLIDHAQYVKRPEWK